MPIKKQRAFITGITGQDGSYLAELLIGKGYEVWGLVRRTSHFNRERIDHLYKPDEEDALHLVYGDLNDPFSLMWALKAANPDEVYHLAAQSHVGVSWETPLYTAMTTGVGTLNVLEAIRVLELKPRIYVAGTSEIFSGRPGESPYNEQSQPDPQSPYGTAKQYSHQIAKNYRDAFGMWIARGILFNHESPRRGENFVTQKVVINAVRTGTVRLGNVSARRDWGHAQDYVEAMWRMLQHSEPDDFVIATGEDRSIQELVDEVGQVLGQPVAVIHDHRFDRPNEVQELRGDARKAWDILGWRPAITFKAMIKEMVNYMNK